MTWLKFRLMHDEMEVWKKLVAQAGATTLAQAESRLNHRATSIRYGTIPPSIYSINCCTRDRRTAPRSGVILTETAREEKSR